MVIFILLMKILLMNYTRTLSATFYIVLASVLLNSCDEPEDDKNGKEFQKNLSSFNNTMNNLDNTLDLMDSMQQSIESVEENRALGIIDDDEAIRQLNQINNTLGKQITHSSNMAVINGIPNWAKQLGLTAPVNMTFDNELSQSTSEGNQNEGFNSIILVYNGNYDEAIKQAGIIAQKANIPMSQDYKDALVLSRDYNIETIKGASYMNFEFGSNNNPQYNISITVDDFGTLTINITDTYALMEQLDN